MAPINIDSTDVSSVTIDGEEVQEITVDGDVVYQATSRPDASWGDYTHRWRMKEGSGDPVDSVTGTVSNNNGFQWKTGAGSGGTYLRGYDSDSDYIDTNVVLGGRHDDAGDRTLACWAKRHSGGDERLLGYGEKSNYKKYEFYFDDSGGALRIEIEGDGITSSLGTSSDTWYAVAIKLNGPSIGDHTLYRSGSTDSISGGTSINTSATNLQIGKAIGQSEYGDISVDDVIVWDRTLSTSELDDWYNATKGNY